MGNITVLAIVIIVVWLAALVYYISMSRQQNRLQDDIDRLRRQLDDKDAR